MSKMRQRPWNYDADRFFFDTDSEDSSMLHINEALKEYLSDSGSRKLILAGSKGTGKSLFLRYKSYLLKNAKGAIKFDLSKNNLIESLFISLPTFSKEEILKYRDAKVWEEIWYLTFFSVTFKAFDIHISDKFSKTTMGSHDISATLNSILFQKYHRGKYASALNEFYSKVNSIKSQVAFFIDGVDSSIENLLTADYQSYYPEDIILDVWNNAQIGLVNAVYGINRMNPHIKIFSTVRIEAYNLIDENNKLRISQIVTTLDYSKEDILEIFYKNIQSIYYEDFISPNSTDYVEKFLGFSVLPHRFVQSLDGSSTTERMIDFIYRHTFGKPRDIIIVGEALHNEVKRPEYRHSDLSQRMDICREVINTTGDRLFSQIQGEIIFAFNEDEFKEFVSCITSNFFTIIENNKINLNTLKKYIMQGLVGWVEKDYNGILIQKILFYSNFPKSDLLSPDIEYYYLHPALDSKFLQYHTYGGFYDRYNIAGVGYQFTYINKDILSINDDVAKVYYNSLKESSTRPLFEAKLILVGEPGSGKTSLMRKIINPNASLTENSDVTLGIDVFQHFFRLGGDDIFRINIWDFGGQEIYTSTHRFFLTKRSLYLLLTDNRRETNNFNYWLSILDLLSENSPLLIIQNEKNDIKLQIDKNNIKNQYSNIKRVLQCNLATNRGLNEIIEEIQHQLQILPHIKIEVNANWANVRKLVEEVSNKKPFMLEWDFFVICQNNGLTKEDARTWGKIMHDLGVILYYDENPILKRWIILQPQWATNAVYQVLDSIKVQDNNGFCKKHEICDVWSDESYEEMYDELIELMKEFKILFKIPEEKSDTFVIPQHLKGKPSSINWNSIDEKSILVEYQFLPRGLFHQILVDMHRYIENPYNEAWDSGAIFKRDGTLAFIEEQYENNLILVRVRGPFTQQFIDRIVEQIEIVNSNYNNLSYKKSISCNCERCKISVSPQLYNYDDLKRGLQSNVEFIQCYKSWKNVEIANLLGIYFSTERINKDIYHKIVIEKPRIFISYSYFDIGFKNAFRKMIAPLEKSGKWDVWDSEFLLPGDIWNDKILSQISTANIVVLLLSPDFFHSPFCYDEEMRIAIDRHKKGEILLIGVLVRSCLYEETPFSEIKILPTDSQPIGLNKDADEIWKEIVVNIKNAISVWKGGQIIPN